MPRQVDHLSLCLRANQQWGCHKRRPHKQHLVRLNVRAKLLPREPPEVISDVNFILSVQICVQNSVARMATVLVKGWRSAGLYIVQSAGKRIANNCIPASSMEVHQGAVAYGDVVRPAGIVVECKCAYRNITHAICVTKQCARAYSDILPAIKVTVIVIQGLETDSCVLTTRGILVERPESESRVPYPSRAVEKGVGPLRRVLPP
jgi:hypothetical protein